MQMDADTLQKEYDKVLKKPGTSTVRASTNNADFYEMIKGHVQKLKNNK